MPSAVARVHPTHRITSLSAPGFCVTAEVPGQSPQPLSSKELTVDPAGMDDELMEQIIDDPRFNADYVIVNEDDSDGEDDNKDFHQRAKPVLADHSAQKKAIENMAKKMEELKAGLVEKSAGVKGVVKQMGKRAKSRTSAKVATKAAVAAKAKADAAIATGAEPVPAEKTAEAGGAAAQSVDKVAGDDDDKDL